MTNGTELAVVDQAHQMDPKTLLQVVSGGDCAALSPEQKVMYYRARCEAAGIDYRTVPFQFIKLQGKEVLYALKTCTEQLSAKHTIHVEVIDQRTEGGIRTVTVRAKTKDGRQTDDIGCVSIGQASGDQLANLFMKCMTKAKRRAILSICGLGMLDETELETIPNASAPPAIPLPLRRSEKEALRKAAQAPHPAVVALGPAPEAEVTNGGNVESPEPLVVPDDDPLDNPLDDQGVIRAQVLNVFEKKGGKAPREWTLTGVEYQDLANGGEPRKANTFNTDWNALAKHAKKNDLVVKLTVTPSAKYDGKFDLASFAIEEPVAE